jgi:hypothetical protein
VRLKSGFSLIQAFVFFIAVFGSALHLDEELDEESISQPPLLPSGFDQ